MLLGTSQDTTFRASCPSLSSKLCSDAGRLCSGGAMSCYSMQASPSPLRASLAPEAMSNERVRCIRACQHVQGQSASGSKRSMWHQRYTGLRSSTWVSRGGIELSSSASSSSRYHVPTIPGLCRHGTSIKLRRQKDTLRKALRCIATSEDVGLAWFLSSPMQKYSTSQRVQMRKVLNIPHKRPFLAWPEDGAELT